MRGKKNAQPQPELIRVRLVRMLGLLGEEMYIPNFLLAYCVPHYYVYTNNNNLHDICSDDSIILFSMVMDNYILLYIYT